MKIAIGRLVRVFAALALFVSAGSAWAQWELDGAKSAVNFISVKNDSVAEVHSFGSLLGYIGGDGKVQLTINLNSVQTLVDIRDQRMKEVLFETVTFPAATVTAAVDPVILTAVAEGGTVFTDLPVTLALHGHEQPLTVPVAVIGEGDGHIRVFSLRPVIIKAADFGLEAGVTALQKLAGLQAISTAVPVTFHLVFSSGK
ncbi:MAG: YceI family protein [Gammaproteobacteria bacterium]|jgi:polyisoprenoid-binding protein YceI|nr:YceI family protein [Gammaproteobacteria bacterium]